MARVLILFFLVLSICSSLHAGRFYKWKDENGVIHITDHPPEFVTDVEVDTGASANRAPMGNTRSSQSVDDYPQVFEDGSSKMSEVDKVRAKQLDAEIASARARYGEMNSDRYSARNLSMISYLERRDILIKRQEAKELIERLLSEKQNLFNKYKFAAVNDLNSAPGSSKYSESSPVIESKINGSFKGWNGETIVELMNGQVWKQAQYYYHYHYAYMPDVLIYNSGGGWKMKVEGVDNSVSVIKLK